MSIISIQRIEVGQVGIKPGRVKILSTDSLAVVTTAGYLNGANLQGITIGPLDVIEMMYGYNASSGTATWSDFTVAISGGIITLSAAVSPGDVLLPVVSGDFPIFNGTSGQIKDSGMSATDPTKAKLVALNAAPLVNHIAYFINANGTIGSDGATIINSGNIQAGISGTAGTFRSFPAGATSGILILAATTNSAGNFNTTITNASSVGQNQVISIPDSGAATANFLLDSIPGGQTISSSTASATPGTIRALTGSITESSSVMTSGNIVGVRGVVNAVGGSGGFWYGVQGKIIATGTLSGSLWAAGIFGQLDVSAATINAGQVAALWGDWGTTGAAPTDMTGTSGIKFTNTTANVLNEQINTYGDAQFYLNIRGNPGPLAYYLAAGTTAGSAGDAAHCAAQQVLKIVVQGATVYIPVFTSNA